MAASVVTVARASLLLAAAALLPVALAPWAAEPLLRLLAVHRAGDQPPFEAVLLAGSGVAVLGCACWLGLAVATAVVDALTDGISTPARRLSPPAVRRLVLLACGAAVGSAGVAVPAAADTAGAGAGSVASASVRTVLTGLPLPDRAAGALRPDGRDPAAAGYVVRPGDSLWRIAARLLAPGGADPDVAAAARALYRANRPTIGPDPDLLLPGQHLRLPRTHPADREDAS